MSNPRIPVGEVSKLAENLLSFFGHRGLNRDDLAAERASMEQRLQELQEFQEADTPTKAQASLECGISCLLQGETLVAFEHFKKAATCHYDPGIHLQALCYGLHCLYMTYQWMAGSQTVPADEMDQLYDLERALPYWVNRISELERFVGWSLTSHMRCLLEQHRAVLVQPLGSSQQLQAAQTLEHNIMNLSLVGVSFQAIAPLLFEISNLYRRADPHSPHGGEVISSLFRKYSDVDDIVGMAHCEMELGDLECAPNGPPEYWGIMVHSGFHSTASKPLVSSYKLSITAAQIESAARHYATAYSLFQQASFRRGLASASMRHGYLATLRARAGDTMRHYQEALRYCTMARCGFEDTGDVVGFQNARVHLMLCRAALGQLPEATHSTREIGIWGRTKGSVSYTFGLGLFIAAQAQQWITDEGDYERGLAAYRLAEALLDGLGLSRPCTMSIVDQTSVHEMLGEHNRFLITAERVLKICRKIYEGSGSPLTSWARQQAAYMLQRILRQAIAREDPDQIENAVFRIRLIYPQQPQTAAVQNLASICQMNLTLSGSYSNIDMDQLGDVVSDQTTQSLVQTAEFQGLMFRASRARRDGDMDKAEGMWKTAELKAQQGEDPRMKALQLANVSTAWKRYGDSESYLNEYCKLSLNGAATARHIHSNLAADLGQLLYQESGDICQHVLPGFTRIGKFDRAGEVLDVLIRLRGDEWWSAGDVVSNLTAAAEVREGQDKFSVAWKLYEQAIEVFEDRRGRLSLDEYKLSLAGGSQLQGLYFKAARTAVKWHRRCCQTIPAPAHTHHLENAFMTLERGKARSLLDLMAAGTLMYTRFSPSGLREWDSYRRTGAYIAAKRGVLRQLYELQNPDKDRISELEVDILAATERQSRQEGRLFAEKSPTAKRFVTTTDVSDIQTLRSQMDKDTVVLQYAYRDNDFIAWAITVDDVTEVYRSVPEIELELRIKRFRQQCQSSSPDIVPGQAQPMDGQWLSQHLLPFEAIPDKSHVIFVAYRALHTLPFHALPFKGSPLVATHSVSYLPSASCITYLQQSSADHVGFKLLAIGNPSNMKHEDIVSGTSQNLRELQFAEAEATYVGRINASSRSLVGKEATKKAVIDVVGEYDILHFATHGILCPEVPMMSSVALADGEELTVGELLGRRLKTYLVVLSACDTGIGQLTDGDDVMGFSRSLLAAGVKNIVVSLWPVHDLATSFLMKRFYEQLQKGQRVSAALREAQNVVKQLKPDEMDRYVVELRKECGEDTFARSIAPEKENPWQHKVYSQPRFWAPFIFIGLR
ncbi:hypothetical protein TruAng_001615 [Truncatella angustata]|nr:hypothetical protein TruAng_001615 [Truncatella angustata]